MEQERTIPPITIYPWPRMALKESEIRNILTYLAYKTNKPVTFNSYTEDEGYSENSVSVRVAAADDGYKKSKTGPVKVMGRKYTLSASQATIGIELDMPSEKQVLDDESIVLAYVDHNRIVIPIEITATDNEASRTLLACIIERAIDLLDFKMNDKLWEQKRQMRQQFCEAFSQGIQRRITEKEDDFRDSEREAQNAYYTIINFEQKRPVIQKELKFLKRLQQIHRPRLFRRQADALVQLLASGQYTGIDMLSDGSVTAVTSPITIKYDNWSFPVGRYQVSIDIKGSIRIEALDEHPDAEYIHPHVGAGGAPCLGNISADIPKLLGSMQVAEALQVLHEFLGHYNPDNPFETIGHFDRTGQYIDEDDNPCEDCDESCTPYCIQECRNNDGHYSCSDCCDYREEYCYLNCEYNQNFSQFKPCDNCEDEDTKHCYLECRYNQKWELRKPCDDNCEFESCSKECPYYKKLESLKEVTENANAG